ncbi:MAG: ATP-binding protein [Bradymonadales bacterium]|nr:MAG: ATP-binding protein [Bradymonadales bacterium]
MFHREFSPLKSRSFFLLGARGTGKSTWVKGEFTKDFHYIDLLQEKFESRYQRNPDLLEADLRALKPKPIWVIIDEIQKVPKLLDIVHRLIESSKMKFVLTGSSARKLKRQSANLLAGRANVYELFPLSCRELGDDFKLDEILCWGSLPSIFALKSAREKSSYLKAYCQTYLKEEILIEQLVRNGQSFRDFLLLAALENGNSLNFSKIGRDLNVDVKSVQTFFSILEDTLLGFYLPSFHRSLRKSQKKQPKFYLFDTGVKRAMEGTLKGALQPRTAAYGKAFEHFFILEAFRMNRYWEADYRFSHYAEVRGGEIDLVLSRGKEVFAVEVKSGDQVDPIEVKKFSRLADVLKPSRKILVSQDPIASSIEGVDCLSWQRALKEIFAQ